MPLLIKHGVLIEKTSARTRRVVVIAEMRGGGGELRRGDDGPCAIETKYTSTYVKSAEISTKLSDHLRDLGYAAMAHHKGGDDIMALPALYASGFGELGRRGGLIHPALGASFRPGFVTTTLPMPLQHFGVDVCPYVHKVNRYDHRKAVYKDYMGIRKKFGYRTPAWWPGDPPDALKAKA